MHKRARNHKIKVDYEMNEMSRHATFQMIFTGKYKRSPYYEPQGKREARKYIKGLLYYKPSNFNEWPFSQCSKR